MITQFHAQFLLLIEEYPSLYKEIDSRIEKFLNDESKRNKDSLPNLGVLMLYLFASQKYKFNDVV